MQTKLTLRLEDELINKAKHVARRRGKSLSKLVSEYFSYIASGDTANDSDLPPIVKSMYGSLSESNIDESDYKKYLENRHL